MKKQIVCLFAAAALLGVGCDDKIPEIGTMDVPATGIVLDEDLRDGVLLEVGQTLDVSWRVTVEPADATDLAEMFYSSNVEVATVSPKGVVTAHKSGITMISIYVAGFEAYFPVQVVDQVPIDIESLAFSEPTMTGYVGVGYTLYVSTQPLDQNEGVIFSSSDPEIASVEAETGRMKCLRVGEATITAAAKNHPEITATMTVTITEFYGDWERTNWAMTFSHEPYPEVSLNSGPKAAIDGDPNSILMMVRPGKQWGTTLIQKVPADEEIWFMVDMKTAHPVNYFRIQHRDATEGNKLVRWRGFSRIEGSDDGQTFEVIATEVAIPDVEEASKDISPDIEIPMVTYRYLKFVGGTDGFSYNGGSATSKGSTVQIKEFYLGRTKK